MKRIPQIVDVQRENDRVIDRMVAELIAIIDELFADRKAA